MLSNIETTLLRTFVTIAETKSFTKSAEKLLRTQSAISMQMKKLEDSLSCQLLNRSHGAIDTTEKGDRLLAYAYRMLRINDEIHEEFSAGSKILEVNLGTSDDYAALLLPGIVQKFGHENPDVHINVSCRNGRENLEMLERQELDFCVVTSFGGDIDGEVVREEPLCWIGSPNFDLCALDTLPLTGFPDGCVCRDAMQQALDKAQRPWRIAYSSNNIISIHAAVFSGLAISAVEQSIVPENVKIFGAHSGLPALPNVQIIAKRGESSKSKKHDKFFDALVEGLYPKAAPNACISAA